VSSADGPYDIQLAPASARAYERLATPERDRIRHALEDLAGSAGGGGRGGKAIKTIQGTRDQFHRLRVGDYRIMYDLVIEDRVVLVLGIVHRSDLERWLRNR
jgi:mRNA-degrading endonuclease RelE of RelBE toxin-antitoxin system